MKNIKIGTKIATMVGIILLFMVVASGYGIYKLDHIGGELRGIAEQNIPLADLVTDAAMSQLEQAVWFSSGASPCITAKPPGRSCRKPRRRSPDTESNSTKTTEKR